MQEKVPPAAWLVPLGAVLAVVGVFTPWFKPQASVKGKDVDVVKDSLYSFKEGRLGLIAPVLIVILAVGVVRLIQGHSVARFNRGSRSPVSSAGLGAVIVGVVALVAAAIAYFTLPVVLQVHPSRRQHQELGRHRDAAQAGRRRRPEPGSADRFLADLVGRSRRADRRRPDPGHPFQARTRVTAGGFSPPAPASRRASRRRRGTARRRVRRRSRVTARATRRRPRRARATRHRRSPATGPAAGLPAAGSPWPAAGLRAGRMT